MTSKRALAFGRYDYAAFISFFAYASSSVVVPVALVTLARDLGFSLESGGMTAGGALQFGRSFLLVASMLVCGFASGRFGKRRTFGVAVLLMSLGVGLCAVAPSYGVLFLVLAIAGLGEGTIEGLATPFVQDLHADDPGRYINFTHGFWSVGVLLTTLGSGALLAAGVSWRAVIALVAAVGSIAALFVLLPVRGGHTYPEHPERISAAKIWKQSVSILRTPRFWRFYAAMFFAGGGEFCLTFWTASYIQLKFESTAWAGGVGTACFAAGMALGRTGWGVLVGQQYLKRLILLSAAGGAAASALLPLIGSLVPLFGLLFVCGIATAPFWPSIQSLCADRMPGKDTTMLFILLSCAGVPGCGFFTWLMGFIADRIGGLGSAFFLVPACFLAIGVLISAERSAKVRTTKQESGSHATP